MPSRQNARRWRRLDWEEIREGIQDPPNPNPPVEEPDFGPAPEPIEVTAEPVPLPTEFSVVVEAEAFSEPETRVQFITNPEHKKKIRELAKKIDELKAMKKEAEEEIVKWVSVNDKQNKIIEKAITQRKREQAEARRLLREAGDDDHRFKQDILYVAKIEKDMFRTLETAETMGDVEIHIHGGSTHAEKGAPFPRPDVTICRGGANEGSDAITMLLGTWINLHPSQKYMLLDFRNFYYWDLIGDCAKDVIKNMVWKCEDIKNLQTHAQEMDGHKDKDKGKMSWESFFTTIVTVKDPSQAPLLQQAMGVAQYFQKKGLDLHSLDYGEKIKMFQAYQKGGKYEDLDFGDREEPIIDPERDRWEAAKNSIINL